MKSGDLAGETSLHVALVEPEIPWNAGNAGRSCLAAGARLHLVHPMGFHLDDRRVRRAGLDYWDRVDPVEWSDADTFEAAWSDLGQPHVFMPDGPRSLWELDLRGPVVCVFGGEGRGFRSALASRWRPIGVRIPQQMNAVRSLNLSNAVAVVLWEALRQRAE
ncbi:MAG TPA: TrmH family RNA methyltransferase [Myxococcales bacterium LLY-WYZ-16_1]|nr:TrmH family RNA methyltransferase [Myxococcales bacterium LLY-WYZ-16_1]